MQNIEFKKTNHVFLDNGIIALYRYLLPRHTHGVVKLDLQDDKLIVKGNDLLKILEDVYYEMGKAVYDTATTEQLNDKGNIYFDRKTLKPHLFPKMNTYGFTELITNNAQGTTRKEDNTTKFEKIKKEEPLVAEKIEADFAKQKIKLLSKIYFDEPYTKITRLVPLEPAHIETGDKFCYLTGEGYKKLVEAQNITPFFSGLTNFNSNLLLNEKVSWKVLYLSRFAAAQCLYAYTNRIYESISVFFFGANSLKKLQEIYDNYIEGTIRHSQSINLREAWQSDKFVKNFNLYDIKDGFCGKDEYQFMILYTIFRNIIQKTIDAGNLSEEDLLFEIEDSDFGSTSETPYIVSLKADAFASTMRPNNFETVTHLKYLMSLFSYLEIEKFDVGTMNTFLQSLKILNPSLRGKQDSYQQERIARNRILKKVVNAQSIIEDIEQIFYDCYIYLSANEQIGFKNFRILRNFVELYESKVNIKNMSKELQKKAIDLGYSIGSKMIEYEGSNRQSNARQSRKFIIDVRNSRTFADFLDALIRIASRFSTGIKHDIAEQVDESNFRIFKSFLTLGMLNAINPNLQTKKEEVK